MAAKTEVPWVYLCLKMQHAYPQAGARLALGLPPKWPANDCSELLPAATAASELAARREAAARRA